MSIHPMVLAELRKRVAELDLRTVRLDLRVPGEGASLSASRRHYERRRVCAMADDYRELIAWAESRDDG